MSNILAPREINLAIAKEEQLLLYFDQLYRKTKEIESFAQQLQEEYQSNSDFDIGQTNVASSENEATVVKLLRTMFEDAVQVHASDIHIEPLEEVMDDMINALDDNHVARLREGRCTVYAGTRLMDIMSNLERISDTCSNVGVSVVARVNPGMDTQAHSYISSLHQGQNEEFNEEYQRAHDLYFKRLALVTKKNQETDGQLSF